MNYTQQPNFDTFANGLGINPKVNSLQPQSPSWSSKLQSLYSAPIAAPESTLGSRITDDVSSAASKVNDAISGTGDYQGKSTLNRATGAVSEGVSGVMNTASEVLPKPVRQGIDAVGKAGSSVISFLGDKIGDVKAVQEWTQKHPQATADLEDLAGTGANLGNIAGGILTAEGGAKGAQKIADAAPKIAEGAKTIASDIGQGISDLKNKVAPTETIEQTAGKVLQGKTKDIESGTSGLSHLDTSKIKTYADLNKASTDKIGEFSKQQDAILEANPKTHYAHEFDQTVGEGTSATKLNYVKEAVNNLKELYQNTADAKGLADISKIESKINGVVGKDGKVMSNASGLSTKDINDLARMYGSEFSSKAFGKTGEALTSVNATKFENIRTGLKDTARNLLPDEASKALDTQMSDLYTVKDLSGKMAEKVNTLSQRLQKTNLLQKVGGVLGKAARVTGVGDLASKLLGIDKVPGAATLNAVELEAQLSKNLGKINAALGKSDSGFVKDIKAMIQEVKDNANQKGAITIGSKSFKAIPDATKKEMMQAIDYLRIHKSVSGIEDTVSKLAQKYNISEDMSNSQMANKFEDLIDKTKTQ